ncbi:MAG: ATPase involved in chromosome partitioning, partial [Frankiales bacterium]|nr:ATPase involved in chromosome partitioning [Frankiales bacterium]
MAIPVLTAVSDAVWEADLVAALQPGDLGVTVLRRCVDLAELLATAATGKARAVLLSADLRRLDRDALTRLAVAGVAVVGLVPPDDEIAELRLRQLGLVHVLPSDASPLTISATVVDAVASLEVTDRSGLSDPRAALPAGVMPAEEEPELLDEPGRVVVVWGPTGAPGRSTVSVTLASELAMLGCSTLLVDADVYGGVQSQLLGLLDESPGLAAACRLANNGSLDAVALIALARQVAPALRVLTGIGRADRWPELRPSALEVVLAVAVELAQATVIDLGFALEEDEELSYDTMAPRRNGATIALLEQADVVLAVGSADPVGLQRLVRGLAELRDRVPQAEPRVVVNKVRRSAIAGDAEREIRAALLRYAGVEDVRFVPLDLVAVD